MARQLYFDSDYRVSSPTLVLATRSYKKIGVIPANNIIFNDNLNGAAEISFNAYKENFIDNQIWDDIKDFKLLWYKELNMWFQISVELKDNSETSKAIRGVSLGEAELSQIMLYNIEINTENDISRDDYEYPTVLYNPENVQISLLHRIKEKAPHYIINHVDNSIRQIQRTFTFNDISIYDALMEICQEINCLVKINVYSDDNGNIIRSINLYDLECYCNDCGYRDEFSEFCPECGSNNINTGYGNDTTIFITLDNLTESINFSTDIDAVKNCFYLEAGDDLMTATIRNCNPNGTNYIWYISDDFKNDMSDDLSNKIEQYINDYEYYKNEADIFIQYDKTGENSNILPKYNKIIKKYQNYKELEELSYTSSTNNENFKYNETRYHLFKGYSDLMHTYYDTVDMLLFLKSELMPSIENTTAEEQSEHLSRRNLSPVAVSVLDNLKSVEKSIEELACFYIDPRYKVKIEETENYTVYGGKGHWDGKLRITNIKNNGKL